MNKINGSKILKYSYIIVSLLLAVAFFTNVTVLFVKAWFTDEVTNHEDVKVAQVDIRILENGKEVGGKVSINHNNNQIQSDDVYTFTPGKNLEYQMPQAGQTINLNIQVKNLGWADGLVRLKGFTICGYEVVSAGGTNNLPIFDDQISVNTNNELWVTQKYFTAGANDEVVQVADMYLNRLLKKDETADVVVSITNNSFLPTKFYISFLAEITVYDSNAYKTNGENPPFGEIGKIPAEWTAWK